MTATQPLNQDFSGYRRAKSHWASVDMSERGKVVLRGVDRIKLLNNLATNDIVKLGENHGCEMCLLDAKGRIVDYVVAFKAGDAIWIDTEPGRAAGLVKHLDRYIIREDVRLEDASTTYRQLAIYGPQAMEAVCSGFELPAFELPNYAVVPDMDGSKATMVRRLDRGVVPTIEIIATAAAMKTFEQKLAQTVDASSAKTLAPHEIELLRIEAGFPRMGVDVEESCLAQEIGRNGRAISFTKGCYLGQETVARLDALGHVNRQLQGVVCKGEFAIERGAKLYLGEKLAGHITSSAHSPDLDATIAIGMIRTVGVNPGTTLELANADGRAAVSVAKFPLVTEVH